jgi:ubiquinol-cytochrome c reductase cytochrome c1 subunit
MKEFKILAVVVFFTLVTYYLVEPYAHSKMHVHVESEGFAYKDIPAMTKKGDAARGKDLVMGAGGCTGCHSITSADIPAPMDAVASSGAYGVNPPDLSDAGGIYAPKFLASLIKNPAHAMIVEHKFKPDSGRVFPMIAFYGAGGDIDQEVADMVAYLQSIAPKPDQITPKQAFDTACGRCHGLKYMGWTQIGTMPKFKTDRAKYAFLLQLEDYKKNLTKYMGKLPPDLSMYIRSRGEHFISTFMEDPQNLLKGTAMPRVGVSAEGAKKVIEYLEMSGDPKRAERNSVGIKVMIFLLVFAAAAYLWKREVWKDLH